MDAPHVYVRALALGFASTVTLLPELFEGADRVAGQLRGDKECPFSGVTKSGKVWRKVPESDARSVLPAQTLTVFVQPPCTIACIKFCVHVKIPRHWQHILLFGHSKILQTHIGMGSAALAAAVPYPGRAT